jgi:cytochrome d ubiquinol oxidase subunit II
MVLISIATPWVSPTVRARWFALPEFIALLPIPLATGAALLGARAFLNSERVLGKLSWLPFALVIGVFLLGALGLAYSLYPYVVMDRLTLWEAASTTESLAVIAVGCLIAVPAIVGYTVFAYRVFRGKATTLNYG